MDNPTTLLVAIMYITIIAIGLGNLLMTLSEIVGGQRKPGPDPVHVSWMLVLLLAYLSYFWETTVILAIDDWEFVTFAFILVGPVVLLFCTNLLIVPQAAESDLTARQFYFEHCGRFFLLLALIQVWNIGLDVIMDNIGPVTYLSVVIGLFLIGLIISKSYRIHTAGAVLGWIFLLSRLGLDVL